MLGIKDSFSIIIPSLALSIAMYTFLSNNSKFREFGAKLWGVVFLQIISTFVCALRLFVLNGTLEYVLFLIMSITFTISWVFLIRTFYVMYGSLYHLRKKRFLKYTKCLNFFYEKFFHKEFYESNYKQRKSDCLNYFQSIPNEKKSELLNGGTILWLYDDTIKTDTFISSYIIDTIKNSETIDYISTYKSPINICKLFNDEEISFVTKKLSIIDCFSPRYSFDDKVQKFKREELANKGFKFYFAESFADVHTAENSSWYRFRETCKLEENQFRLPHRTVYDTLSSMINYSSLEQYMLFLRHVVSSEKSYGMITIILEPISIKEEIKSELIRMADFVL